MSSGAAVTAAIEIVAGVHYLPTPDVYALIRARLGEVDEPNLVFALAHLVVVYARHHAEHQSITVEQILAGLGLHHAAGQTARSAAGGTPNGT